MDAPRPDVRLLAVFNAFDTPNPGGVQVAGRIAWDAIRAAQPDARALLVSLEPQTGTRAAACETRGAGRVGSLRAARRVAGAYDVALFWHLDLLKLAPFLGLPDSCRRVLFLHGTEAWDRRSWLTRRQLGRMHTVIANTRQTLERAIVANPVIAGLRAQIVHLGIGDLPDKPVPPPDATPAAAMISRLHPAERYKGHDEVIAAWPRVLARVPNAQLWIVGDGVLASELQTAAEQAGVADYVRFFGRVSETEKQVLLSRARCLLLPSTGEGFGLVYLEAMRLGRPVLTGMDGGHEVANPPEAGLAVAQRTPDEIAAAVVRLLTLDAAWQSWSAAAQRRYAREFTAQRFGERIVGALEAVHA